MRNFKLFFILFTLLITTSLLAQNDPVGGTTNQGQTNSANPTGSAPGLANGQSVNIDCGGLVGCKRITNNCGNNIFFPVGLTCNLFNQNMGQNQACITVGACTGGVDGLCGSEHNGVSAPTGTVPGSCAAGTYVAGFGADPWSWTCAGSAGGADASCSSNTDNFDGVCGSENGGTSAPTGTNPGSCSAGVYAVGPTDGVSTWTWYCNSPGAGANATCNATNGNVNGLCGSFYNTRTSTGSPGNPSPMPSPAQLCSSGTAGTIFWQNDTKRWYYQCNGRTGTNQTCYAFDSAYPQIADAAACGSAHGTTVASGSPPSSNLCTTNGGSVMSGYPPTLMSGPDRYEWRCNTQAQLATAYYTCSANISTGPSCGTAHNSTCSGYPGAAAGCNSGTYATGSSGGGNWNWTCTQGANSRNCNCGSSDVWMATGWGTSSPDSSWFQFFKGGDPSGNSCGTPGAHGVWNNGVTYMEYGCGTTFSNATCGASHGGSCPGGPSSAADYCAEGVRMNDALTGGVDHSWQCKGLGGDTTVNCACADTGGGGGGPQWVGLSSDNEVHTCVPCYQYVVWECQDAGTPVQTSNCSGSPPIPGGFSLVMTSAFRDAYHNTCFSAGTCLIYRDNTPSCFGGEPPCLEADGGNIEL